jgi:hypothetical protein
MLWDWIKIAYPEVDNWKDWVYWASGKDQTKSYPIKNQYYVGCRMLQAPKTGILEKIEVNAHRLPKENIVEIVITKPAGSQVTSLLKDNSDFIGYIVCKHKESDALRNLLDVLEESILSTAVIS